MVPDKKRQPRAARNAQGPPKQRASRHDFLDHWWPVWGRAKLPPHYQPVRLIVRAAPHPPVDDDRRLPGEIDDPPLHHILVSSLVTLFRRSEAFRPTPHPRFIASCWADRQGSAVLYTGPGNPAFSPVPQTAGKGIQHRYTRLAPAIMVQFTLYAKAPNPRLLPATVSKVKIRSKVFTARLKVLFTPSCVVTYTCSITHCP